MALLKFKRSAVPAKVPSIADLALGELAINTYDGKVYTKKDDGTQAIVEVGGGGGVQTITSSDGSVTVTGTTDINLSVPVTAATNTVILPVRNNSGATLAKGTAVYINGALGQNPTVTKAIATGDATSAQTLGLVTANIANNAVGNVTLIGSLTNLDTSAYSDGAQLYLSPTTAGALTATKPYAPNHLVYMAVVEHAHPSLGKLFVKVQNGYEMDELHNVAAQSPANNDGLFYNTTTSLWEKKSIVTALGYTPYNATNPAGYITSSASITGNAATVTSITANTGLGRNSLSAGIVDGLTTTNFRTTMFGNTAATYNIATSRWNSVPTAFSGLGPYGTAIAWSGNDTHAFLALNFNSAGAKIGGGNSDNINWSADLLHSANYTSYAMPSGSSATNSVDVRAPIFYDSQNTGYYVDAASGFYLAGAGSTTYQSTSSGLFVANPESTGSTVRLGAAWSRAGSYSNSSYTLGSESSIHFWISALEKGYIDSSSNLFMNGSVRAPIFYDSNNTGYYVDPASTSALNIITTAGYIQTYSGGVKWDESGTRSWSMYPSGGAILLNSGDGAGSFNLGASGGVRAPIFYDSNNTGYYIDPASTSNLNSLNLASGSVLGAAVTFNNMNQPHITYTDANNVVSFGFRYLQGGTNGPAISGASQYYGMTLGLGNDYGLDGYGSQFYWPRTPLGGLPYPSVRFRENGTWGAWSKIYAGWADAPSGSTFAATGDFRAPIFYDSNNTGYYLDAASTGTSLNVAGNIIAAGNVTTYSDIRVKANVETIPSALDKLDHIRGVTYTRTDLDDKEQRYAGVIAQEIEAVLPEAVRDLGNIKAVDYNATIALLIQAVKELRDEVEALRK